MRNCKQISRLVSESYEQKLSLPERFELWMHLRICRLCGAFGRDLRVLHNRTQEHAADLQQISKRADHELTSAARQRIQQAVDSRIP